MFSVARENRGFTLECIACGHERSWTASELAAIEPPTRTLWEFISRRKCGNCGAKGAQNATSYQLNGASPPTEWPTPAQLWRRWPLVGTPPQMV